MQRRGRKLHQYFLLFWSRQNSAARPKNLPSVVAAPPTVGRGASKMNEFEKICNAIVSDPRYQRNLDWGEPRSGHAEGTIRARIAEIERNLEVLRPKLSAADYWKLKILIHTHDSFKREARRGVAITAPESHASLARAFLGSLCDDPDLLAMVQYHDEPFALWQQFDAKGKFSEQRLAGNWRLESFSGILHCRQLHTREKP